MEMKKEEFMNYHKDTELRLGLPGSNEIDAQSVVIRSNKRSFSSLCGENPSTMPKCQDDVAPSTKVQVIGWPPVKSYRKNIQATKVQEVITSQFVKVSMDGAPYLRKIDLHLYKSYNELLKMLEEMFKLNSDQLSKRDTNNNCSEYEPAYEDKDGDWMLVGDVPWELFITSCKRLRIMKKDVKQKIINC